MSIPFGSVHSLSLLVVPRGRLSLSGVGTFLLCVSFFGVILLTIDVKSESLYISWSLVGCWCSRLNGAVLMRLWGKDTVSLPLARKPHGG